MDFNSNIIASKNLPVVIGQENKGDRGKSGTQTLVRPKKKLAEPPMYKVVLLNDDFTPMDFVVYILKKFFKKSETEANQIMLQIHHQGAGIAGIYTAEIAESKVLQVNNYSKKNEHPLKCIMEKEA